MQKLINVLYWCVTVGMSLTALNMLVGTTGTVRGSEFGMLISMTHLLSWLLLWLPLQGLMRAESSQPGS